MKKKRALVVGGSGFLGSHVADALTNDGLETIVLDSKPSPYLSSSQHFIHGDLLDEKCILRALKGVDYVFHFAGVADIQEAAQNPVEAVRSNILGTTLLLDAAIKAKVKRFFFGSTIYVYSKTGSFYRATKQSCEALIEAFHETSGLPYTFLRYGSLYGPRSQDWNSLRRYVKQALTEGKITFHGSGQEKREYIHVEDAARLTTDCMDTKFENESVIITGSQLLSGDELLVILKEILGSKIKIEKKPSEISYHYAITPYHFQPKVGRKLVSNHFVDFGQGVLQLSQEVSKNLKL